MNFFGKSHNEIETELKETKSKLQVLEEKIEFLLKRHTDILKILCETTNKLQIVEEKLQKNTSSLISFTNNSKINVIDINCSNINIIYTTPDGFIIIIDNVEISSNTYSFVSIRKIINQLKNIQNIKFEWRFPIADNLNTKEIPEYFAGHFDIIKQVIELNNKVKIMMSFTSYFPFEWIKYMFKDIHINNILEIEILYHIDNSEYIIDILTNLNEKLNNKIIFKNSYKKPLDLPY